MLRVEIKRQVMVIVALALTSWKSKQKEGVKKDGSEVTIEHRKLSG